jgi:hypothetical protein
MLDLTVLDRIEMDVIEMAGEIALVPDCVLPIAGAARYRVRRGRS